MVIPYYPFDIRKFPDDDDDILLTEDDLQRKNVVYCRKEILEQMKCTKWAKDEYLLAGLDPENNKEWLHYHLNKCYTPYMDAMGCLFSITDREIQKMKEEAGADGWKKIEAWFINDVAKTAGENNAKKMWELTTNLKQIHETTRRRDGHLFGEKRPENNGSDESQNIRPRPFTLAEAMGINDLKDSKNTTSQKKSHLEVESIFAIAKEEEIRERSQQEKEKKKSWWRFGSSS